MFLADLALVRQALASLYQQRVYQQNGVYRQYQQVARGVGLLVVADLVHDELTHASAGSLLLMLLRRPNHNNSCRVLR